MALSTTDREQRSSQQASSRRWRRRISVLGILGLVMFLSFQNLTQSEMVMLWSPLARNMDGVWFTQRNQTDSLSPHPERIVIAYAVTITACNPTRNHEIIDHVAVLHQSIRVASRFSKYDYEMIAFVHPDAQDCSSIIQDLGYQVKIRDTPFDESEMTNQDLREAQKNTCCGVKEYMKLYSYLQFDYPIVVHLDVDCMVLKPLDAIFDAMLLEDTSQAQIPAMWIKSPLEFPPRIDFIFTRDYGMVEPKYRKPRQVGVQGGFLVVRPNQTDFDRFIELIRSGENYQKGFGWGGMEKRYGGYYGAGTIQGLASYYYGEISLNRSVEINRCYYGNMVDNPYGDKKVNLCRTSETTCQDCRKVNLEEVFLTHFTNCGKPTWCLHPKDWRQATPAEEYRDFCMQFFRKWHFLRLSLENEWKVLFKDRGYQPQYAPVPNITHNHGRYRAFSYGHCKKAHRYTPMQYPNEYVASNITFTNKTQEILQMGYDSKDSPAWLSKRNASYLESYLRSPLDKLLSKTGDLERRSVSDQKATHRTNS